MPLPTLLASLLGAVGTGAKTIGKGTMTVARALPKIGNTIGKGLVTGSGYLGQISNNLSPLVNMMSGYSGNTGQLRQSYETGAQIISQNNQSPYNYNTNPYNSSAFSRKLRGLLGG